MTFDLSWDNIEKKPKTKTKKRLKTKRKPAGKSQPQIRYCRCPNCGQKAIRFERKIVCEYCDAIFVVKKQRECHVHKVGVTQEVEKAKRKSRWFF
jgi:hypothetical protein